MFVFLCVAGMCAALGGLAIFANWWLHRPGSGRRRRVPGPSRPVLHVEPPLPDPGRTQEMRIAELEARTIQVTDPAGETPVHIPEPMDYDPEITLGLPRPRPFPPVQLVRQPRTTWTGNPTAIVGPGRSPAWAETQPLPVVTDEPEQQTA